MSTMARQVCNRWTSRPVPKAAFLAPCSRVSKRPVRLNRGTSRAESRSRWWLGTCSARPAGRLLTVAARLDVSSCWTWALFGSLSDQRRCWPPPPPEVPKSGDCF